MHHPLSREAAEFKPTGGSSLNSGRKSRTHTLCFHPRMQSCVRKNLKRNIRSRKTYLSVSRVNTLRGAATYFPANPKKKAGRPSLPPKHPASPGHLGTGKHQSLSLDTKLISSPHLGGGVWPLSREAAEFKPTGGSSLNSGRKSRTHTLCFHPRMQSCVRKNLKRNIRSRKTYLSVSRVNTLRGAATYFPANPKKKAGRPSLPPKHPASPGHLGTGKHQSLSLDTKLISSPHWLTPPFQLPLPCFSTLKRSRRRLKSCW